MSLTRERGVSTTCDSLESIDRSIVIVWKGCRKWDALKNRNINQSHFLTKMHIFWFCSVLSFIEHDRRTQTHGHTSKHGEHNSH